MHNLDPVDDATFDAVVLGGELPVLVDFWAERCRPCVALARHLEDLGETFEGRVTIVALDVDDNPGVRTRYGIDSLPTLKLFKGGAPVATQTGSKAKSQIAAWLRANL